MPEVEKTEISEIVAASRQYENAKMELEAAQVAIDIANRQLAQKQEHYKAVQKRVSDGAERIKKLAKTL